MESRFLPTFAFSCFGKTAENKRNYKDVEMTCNIERAYKLAARPRTKRWKVFGDHLAAFLQQKTSVVLDRPRYIGFTVLEDSKIMFDSFHHDFILPLFGADNVKVCHMDTGKSCCSLSLGDIFHLADSFTYHISTEEDAYEKLKGRTHFMDFSNYPKDHPNYTAENYLVPGFWKEEGKSKLLLEFAGLRAKMYSLLYMDGTDKLAAKGVLRSVQSKQLRHELYRQSLFEERQMSHTGYKIMKKEHDLYTVKMKKNSLCPFNDKITVERKGDEFICHSFGFLEIAKEPCND